MSCNRFEREGLLLLEEGEPLSEHFATCEDCLAARGAYERLQEGLRWVASEAEPSEDWQARTWRAIREQEEDRSQEGSAREGRRWWQVIPGLTAVLPDGRASPSLAGIFAYAVAALFLVAISLYLLNRSPTPARLALAVSVEAASTSVRRGDEAEPGDTLLLEASTRHGRYTEIRVYFNERRAVYRCAEGGSAAPEGPPAEGSCEAEGGRLTGRLPLQARGAYQPMLLVSEAPLPAAQGGLDSDVGLAVDSGARVVLGAGVTVR